MKSEAAVQAECRVRCSELGLRMWRNNSGVLEDINGRPVRYGLANDSAQMNKRIKSHDLIGWWPRCVWYADNKDLPPVAQFVSIECKREDWFGGYPNVPDRKRFNEREEAQAVWLDMVRADGGISGFVRCVAELDELLGVRK